MLNERTIAADKLNADCISTLNSHGFSEGGFIVVVGAGVSIPLIPAGGGLRAAMAEACEIDNDPAEHFWEFFQRAQDAKPAVYRQVIIETFCEVPEWHSEACYQLVRLPCKSIITLNYDDHLQSAFSKKFGMGWNERFAVYPVQDKKRWVFSHEYKHNFHLLAAHGYRVRDESKAIPDLNASWPDDGIILTTKQFYDHYFNREKGHYLYHWWADVLCNFSCLFIGMSLQEPGIESVIRDLEKAKNPGFLKHKRIHLQATKPIIAEDPKGPQIIYPDPKPPLSSIEQVLFDPKQGYRGMLEILSDLSKTPLRDSGSLESGKRAPEPPSYFNIS